MASAVALINLDTRRKGNSQSQETNKQAHNEQQQLHLVISLVKEPVPQLRLLDHLNNQREVTIERTLNTIT
jgi:hypothetical protein